MLIVWILSIKSLPNLLFGVLCLPGDQSHPVCETVNKPSCVLHLLDWFIGSRGFSSLGRRPEFWVLQGMLDLNFICNLLFLKMCDACLGVVISLPLSRSEIRPPLKKIERINGPDIWNLLKEKCEVVFEQSRRSEKESTRGLRVEGLIFMFSQGHLNAC